MTVKFDGLKAIGQSMRDLPKEISRRKEVLDPGLVAGAVIVRDAAKEMVPVDTGVLKRNIIVQRWKRPGTGMAATVVVRVRKLNSAAIFRLKMRNKAKGVRLYKGDPFYWSFVEFGTSKKEAMPFLRPSFDLQKVRGVEAAVMEFKKRVQGVVKKLGERSIDKRLQVLLLRHKGRSLY